MSKNNSKKHHFLPRSILKHFTIQDNVIYVYDKKLRKMYPSSITNAGAENNYNVVNIEGKDYNLEEIFNDFDGNLASVINQIIINGSIINEQQDFLLYAILVQLLRSPMERSSYVSVANLMKEIVKDIVSQEDLQINDIDKNQAKLSSILSITEIHTDLLDVIKHRKVILLKDTENKLITSDNSVVMHCISNYDTVSLKSHYTEIDFPISPKFALSIAPDKVVEGIRNNSKNYRNFSALRNAILTGCSFPISEDYRHLLNSLQVLRSKRFVYSNYDCSDLIAEILEKNPNAANQESLLTIGPIKKKNISCEKHIVFWIDTDYQKCELVDYKYDDLALDFVLPSKHKNMDIFNKFLTKISIFDQQVEAVMMRNVNITIVSIDNDTIRCHAANIL